LGGSTPLRQQELAVNTSLPGALLVATFLAASVGACTKLDHSAANPAAIPVLPTTNSARSVSGAGVKAFIDPITGEMREPTAAEVAAAASSSQATSAASGKVLKANAPLEEVLLPNGATMVRFGNQVEEKVCINAAGEVTSKCPAANAASNNKAGTK
jgi:hypothetical protein